MSKTQPEQEPHLPAMAYRTILAGTYTEDSYTSIGGVAEHGADIDHASTPQAHLYLWVGKHEVPQAYELMHRLGYTPESLTVFTRVEEEWDNALRPTLERYGAADLEENQKAGKMQYHGGSVLLFGRRNLQHTSDHPMVVVTEGRTDTAIPDEAYGLIEKASPGNRIEMFGVCERDGWDSWNPK